jgi:cytochrome oxidase Cu insertion factor (SCO1/SenC/PrrC family)
MRPSFAMASLFAFAFSGGCLSPEKPIPDIRGKAAADFELADLDGKSVRLSDFKGQPVLLAFWAYG